MSAESPATKNSPPRRGTPLRSMTGFAQARREQDGWALRISLRSVNHRFLDLHVRLPEGFEPLEPAIRQIVRDHLRRGHVDVTLNLEASGAAAVHVNAEVAAEYLKAARKLRDEMGIGAEPDLAALLRLPGVIGSAAAGDGDAAAMYGDAVRACLAEALRKLDAMREAEGSALTAEMNQRLARIAELAAQVEPPAARARPAYARRLEQRVRELLGETPLDPARLAQEAALLAERGDVAEEIARLRSHVEQYQALLAAGGEVGKKFDFLLQEMQREANTLLSKTPGVEEEGLAITSLALEIKSEIEKLREQVQNVE